MSTNNNTTEKPYYVTMSDKFMSGWGKADGRINKLVFVCKDYAEAEIVERNAGNRSEMKYVNICVNKPYYNSNRYYTQIIDDTIYPNWYRSGYFGEN